MMTEKSVKNAIETAEDNILSLKLKEYNSSEQMVSLKPDEKHLISQKQKTKHFLLQGFKSKTLSFILKSILTFKKYF